MDLLYTEGLTTDCGEPLCCRPPNKPVSPAAGPWGDYLCDVPLATLNDLFEHLNRSKDQFDWIYWTGDLPAHNVWSQTREDQLGVINLLTDQMRLFFGDKKVYPTLGNHESAPVNRLVHTITPCYVQSDTCNMRRHVPHVAFCLLPSLHLSFLLGLHLL